MATAPNDPAPQSTRPGEASSRPSATKRYLSRLGRSFIPDVGVAEDEFLDAYRSLLIGQYQALGNIEPESPARKVAEDVIKKGEEATWEDLYKMETAIIAIEPEVYLRRRAWTLRNEFNEVASAAELKDYVASGPPDPKTAKIDELRADMVRIQQEIHWRYIVTWIFEQYRAFITRRIFFLGLGVILGAFILNCLAEHGVCPACLDLNWPLIFTVMAAGFVGGNTSTIRRIQQARLVGNADVDLAKLLQGNMSVYISPVLGATFALILFLMFAAKLAEGGVFPRISFDLVFSFSGADFDGTEFAKLLVWSFIAGFAETFVPDKLSRLASESEKTGDKKNG